MFYFAFQIFKPILSFALVVSFAFFFISLLMIVSSLMPRSKITVGNEGVGGGSFKSAIVLCLGTFVSGTISLAALYFYS